LTLEAASPKSTFIETALPTEGGALPDQFCSEQVENAIQYRMIVCWLIVL
jgi:hypothetical protein